MNAITGLPRSGSTLLCNILNQNPNIYCSSTSILPGVVNGMATYMSQQLEYKYELDQNRKKAEKKLVDSIQAFCDTWYKRKENIIFDKSRGWTMNVDLLTALNGKSILLVRDIRNRISSVEKQNRNTPIFGENHISFGDRLDQLLDPVAGIVGHSLSGVKSLIDRNYNCSIVLSIDGLENHKKSCKDSDVLIVKYEYLSKYPKEILELIYSFIDVDLYEHDFENVKNTSKDCDGLYLYKFPHEGSGKVIEKNPLEYKKYMSPIIANMITEKYKWFYKIFQYND